MLRSPGRSGPIAVTFDQDYRSSSFSQVTRKRQYWIEAGGRRRIAYEAPLSAPVLTLPESFRGAARQER